MAQKSIRRTTTKRPKKDNTPPEINMEEKIEEANENDNHSKNNYVKLADRENTVRNVITCICCGQAKYEDFFYRNRSSPVFGGVYNHIPVCRDCLDALYRSFALKYEPMVAAAAMCAIMDIPYNEAMVHTHITDGKFQIGSYSKSQNIRAMKDKTFIFSINNGEFFDAKEKLQIEVEKSWSRQDKQNKNAVIQKYGYDPFDSFGFEDGDYRTAFNITAQYLTDESILQDAHKMQSLVTMVATIIQSNKVEALLTRQYKNINPDTSEIKTLTATKKDLQTTISKLAEDNNISSKYQKENKSAQSHLTAKMKEMSKVEYWEAKPNMFDVRTSAAMKQMMDLSHQSIIDQLELSDSEYAQMVKDQREMIKNLQEKCDRLEEELRNTTNRLLAATVEEGK